MNFSERIIPLEVDLRASIKKSIVKSNVKEPKPSPKTLLEKPLQNLYKKYFGEIFDKLNETNHQIFTPPYQKKVSTIMYETKLNQNQEIYFDFQNKFVENLQPVFEKIIFPCIPKKLRSKYPFSPNAIKKNIHKILIKQRTPDLTTDNIISIINFQIGLIDLSYFIKKLGEKKNHFIYVDLTSNLNLYEDDKSIVSFLEQYIDPINVIKSPTLKHPRPEEELDEKDELIIEMLSNIFNEFIIKIQKYQLSNDQKNDLRYHVITYGSYSAYLINNQTNYNDIDIYINNPSKILINMLLLFSILFNIDTDIHKIPFIPGHLSMRYKKKHFADCLYIDNPTFDLLENDQIKNTIILNPLIQVLNNFRMFSEIKRLDSIFKERENAIKKYAALLDQANKNLEIDFTTLRRTEVIYEIVGEYIIIDLVKTFKCHCKESFDYLIIPLISENSYFEFINRKNILISRQYLPVFNEVVVEINNKVCNTEFAYKQNVLGLKITKNNSLQRKAAMIQETRIIEESPNREILNNINIDDTNKRINELIDGNNNILIMSAFTTNTYLKYTYDKNDRLIKQEITNISLETILSSYVLYMVLKRHKHELIKTYCEKLFGFLKYNDKSHDYHLMSDEYLNNNDIKKKERIGTHRKIKLKGIHKTYMLGDQPLLKPIFFFNSQTKNYYSDINQFKELCVYGKSV